MKKFLLSLALAFGLLLSVFNTTAYGWWGPYGGYYGGGYYGGGNAWVGAAVGLAAISIMMNQAAYSRGYYYNRYPYYRGYPRYYRGGYYRGGYYYRSYPRCMIIRGHYDYYGYWIPRQRVCR